MEFGLEEQVYGLRDFQNATVVLQRGTCVLLLLSAHLILWKEQTDVTNYSSCAKNCVQESLSPA